ncbi:hypothetical protein B0J13DRAFT_573447 [Dactylonectria estremocensis]|uniref:Uncharacterized protein n=1 Tax=Dactylonectria estremocensis TaxID=1079267 RepID=A0A9P9D8C4_9HYPO|nr:hypothetical protein B0J13DRAFT_573447 [Dactylonectria estremocensis]
MVLWKLAEYVYMLFTYQYKCRNALPEVEFIVNSHRQDAETSEGRKRHPRPIAAGAADEERSVKRPATCFFQRRNVPSQRDMTEALILSQMQNHDTLQEFLQKITPIPRPIDEHWDEGHKRVAIRRQAHFEERPARY